MKFFIGLDHPSVAWPFLNVMVSVNSLSKRQSGFLVNNWILDSGSFSNISRHGKHLLTSEQYTEQIIRLSENGNLLAAVCQDWMCEPFILEITGKTIGEHQELTVASYVELSQWLDVPIMPVLQGYAPADYVRHVRMYGDRLIEGTWTGVGSICKRNSNPDAIEDVLLAIKAERPDLQLHGFGLKVQALERATIRSMLASSDSMAWSMAGRKESDAHDPRRALRYAAQVEKIIEHPVFVQEQLAKWWG